MNITQTLWGRTLAISLLGTVMSLGLMASFASADVDPAGCTANGINISITTLRADGITPVGAGTVQSGETINFQTTLQFAGAPNCNFEGGTVTITTPDTVVHNVGSPGLVSSGSPFISSLATYVVSESQAVGGIIGATTDYTGGTAHRGDGFHPAVSGSTGDGVPFQDVSLVVTKTANPAFDRITTWTIDKSVDDNLHDLFTGQTATSTYSIVIDKTVVDSNHSVSGTITIHNPASFADAVITNVSDVLTIDGAAVVDCGATIFPFNLGPGTDLVCTYSKVLAGNTTQTNTATVATSGDVGGDSGDAQVDFTGVNPTTIGLNQVTITDTNSEFATQNGGNPVQTSDDVTYNYDIPFTCDTDEGQHPNTATIVETQQSDDALVTVNCTTILPLVVEKTSRTAHTRDWNWTINKNSTTTDLLLAEGQSYTVNYTVDVSAVAVETLDASGTISITNPVGNPAATITGVTDVLSVAGAAVVTCAPNIFPQQLAGGATLNCTYQVVPGAPTDQTNTATVTTSGSVPAGFDTVDVNFDEPTDIDECIVVNDDNPNGPQNVVICQDTVDKTIDYSVTFGPDTNPDVDVTVVCDENSHLNTASYVTQDDENDTDESGNDNWTVNILVDCFQGCTLTQGYWKNHSREGKAPYDDGWQLLGVLEEDTLFFNSAKTWYELFQMPPKGGNAYIQLAHQYMAAKLNILNGASETAAVTSAIAGAEALFTAQGVGDMTLTKPETSTARGHAGALGTFTAGAIGPGTVDAQNPV